MRGLSQLVLLAIFAVGLVGCSTLSSVETVPSPDLAMGPALKPSAEAAAFQRIQQAAALNAAVIYFEGDSSGPKLLRLPDPGQTIYLAGVLDQIGATKKYNNLNVTLWRVTPDSPSGAKLAVRFKRGGRIDPLTDYAILPGDRITIAEAEEDWFQGLL